MLGLILIYFVGRAFYRLAETYNKSKWGFAVLGVASYYAGLFLGAMLIGVVMGLIDPYMIDEMPEIAFGLMCIPLGVLACWGTYKLLERTWKQKRPQLDLLDAEVQDEGADF